MLNTQPLQASLINEIIIMGLDICHVKPSFKTSETSEYFTLKEFSHFPEFIEKYSYLITIVETTDGGKKPDVADL